MRNSIKILLLAEVLVAGAPAQATAAGELDPTFSGDGWAVVPFDFGIWSGADAKRILTVPDGKILILGTATGPVGVGADFAFARLTSAGDLDSTFGTGGRFTTGFNLGSGDHDIPLRFALAPGGKIVAVGYAYHGNDDWQPVAVRIREAPGTGWELDPTFAGDGKLIWDLRGGYDYSSVALGVDVLAGGEIIASGMRMAETDYFGVPWVSKLLPVSVSDALALDPAFGDQGLFFFGDTWSWHDAADTTVTFDGRIVGVGVTGGEWGDMLAFRVSPDGQLDTSFAGAGWARVDMPGASFEDGVTVLASGGGSAYLVGRVTVGGYGNLGVLVAKLDTAGALDPEFGSGGLAYVSPSELGGDVQVKAAVLQGDGRMVIAGALVLPGEDQQFIALRLTPAGALDPTFGVGGVAHLAVGPDGSPPEWGAWDTAMQPDGRLLLVGTCYLPSPQGTLPNFCVARLINDYIFADGFESGDASDWPSSSHTGAAAAP